MNKEEKIQEIKMTKIKYIILEENNHLCAVPVFGMLNEDIDKNKKRANCKLTDKQVLEIRKEVVQGVSRKLLAKKYGITVGYISNIVCGYARKNLKNQKSQHTF